MNNKGKQCVYVNYPLTCQEGECSDCEIYRQMQSAVRRHLTESIFTGHMSAEYSRARLTSGEQYGFWMKDDCSMVRHRKDLLYCEAYSK